MLSNSCYMLSKNCHVLFKDYNTVICCVRDLICCVKLDNICIAMYFSDGERERHTARERWKERERTKHTDKRKRRRWKFKESASQERAKIGTRESKRLGEQRWMRLNVYARACVRVCVWERKRARDLNRQRARERERERASQTERNCRIWCKNKLVSENTCKKNQFQKVISNVQQECCLNRARHFN